MPSTPENSPAEPNAWIPAPRPHVGLSAPAPLGWDGGTQLGWQPPPVTRSGGKRVGRLLASAIGIFAVWFAVMIAVTARIDPASYMTYAEYDTALNIGVLVSYLICLPIMVALYASLCPKVGYRRRDAFLIFVPIYNYYFSVMILWRATALPDRPWTPRHDEQFYNPATYSGAGAHS